MYQDLEPYKSLSDAPRLESGLLDFAALRPEHRSSYLNGWEYATLKPSKNYSGQSGEFFNAGADEARLLTTKAS